MNLRLTFPFVTLAFLACSCASKPPAQDGHVHKHHHDGPLVHRFERAEDWKAELEGPDRDAWQRPGDVVAAMEIAPGAAVADVGAGTGYFEQWLSRAVGEKGAVLAVDVEPDMVRHLKERAVREKLTNVRPSLATTDDPQLPAASVDRILVVDTWHHIANREAYAAKLRAALRPGGKVFVVDFKLDAAHGPPPAMRVSPEVVARELTAGGLTAAVASVELPQQYVVVGTRPTTP